MIEWALKSQKSIIDMLKKSYDRNRLSHAYLFSGEDGTERLGVALYFAMMLYCKDVCLECKNCINIMNFKHPNVIYIKPMGQNIKKEQVLALQKEFSKTSLTDGPRIYIIDEADKLSSGAANSLLKFIEEPLSNETYGILITNNITGIIPTILSRTQVVNFLPAKRDILFQELCSLQIDEVMARIIPQITNSLTDAKQYYSSPTFAEIIKIVIQIGGTLAYKKGNAVLLFKNYQGILEDSQDFSLLLKIMLLYFMDVLKDEPLVFYKEKDNIEILKKQKKLIIHLSDEIIKMQKRIAYNVNNGLMFECFLLEIDRSV